MKKNTFFVFLFSLFLFPLFFYNRAFALEVQYPQIGSTPALNNNTTLPTYFKYIFDLGMGLGILIVIATLAVGGVLYVLSSANPKWKATAMDRISGAITGFFLLLFTYLIITTINPELSVFRFNFTATPPPPKPTPTQTLTPGVSLYTVPDCVPEITQPGATYKESTFVYYTSSVNNLGAMGDNLKSGKIVQDPANKIYYIAFMHDFLNFQKGCEEIDPNPNKCTNVINAKKPISTASSMSVYRYNMQDNGNGVIFYRKPYFKTAGGWVALSKTTGLKLEGITFNGNGGKCTVPEEEQDCIKWETNGQCAKNSRKCPKLTPENINSINVGGKYIVLFFHDAEITDTDTNTYAWSNCQIFPTPEDTNFTGPKEMKWDYIRNYGDLPDAVAIFPIIR